MRLRIQLGISSHSSLVICKLSESSPIDKDQLVSAGWSILIMSNNGDGDPIAYERDFTLIVGSVITTSTTMTATVTQVSTPVVNTTGELNFSAEMGNSTNSRSDYNRYCSNDFADRDDYGAFSGKSFLPAPMNNRLNNAADRKPNPNHHTLTRYRNHNKNLHN
jgi:hypothetical protein